MNMKGGRQKKKRKSDCRISGYRQNAAGEPTRKICKEHAQNKEQKTMGSLYKLAQ